MGSETSREFDSSTHSSGNPGDAIDVAAYEAEVNKMRGINRMDRAIRSRLQQGVKYNMRVLICGDKGTGKTLLWRRFQGQAFDAEHIPTPEIQSATIDWTSPSASAGSNSTTLRSIHSDDVVKVDVWDVVDKAIHTQQNSLNRHSTADLVYNFNQAGEAELSYGVAEGKHALKLLDSSAVDIYKDTHAVIFMLNPHSEKSLQYVRDKYPLVPDHISILLVLNFRDKIKTSSGAHSPAQPSPAQAVSLPQVRALAEEIRGFRSNQQRNDVTVLETSLLDCYGLLHLHHYLDVPFLRLKHKSLQDQLALVEGDLHTCHAHLNDSVRLSNYDEYLRHYETRKRERQMLQQQSTHGFPQVPPAAPLSCHPTATGAGTTAESAPNVHSSGVGPAVSGTAQSRPLPVSTTPSTAHPVILRHSSTGGVDSSSSVLSVLSAAPTQTEARPQLPLYSSANTNFSGTASSDTAVTASDVRAHSSVSADRSATHLTSHSMKTGTAVRAGTPKDISTASVEDALDGADAADGALDCVLEMQGDVGGVLDGFLEMDSDTEYQDRLAGTHSQTAQVPLSLEAEGLQHSNRATNSVSPPHGNRQPMRTSRGRKNTTLSDSEDSDEGEGISKLAQKVGFGGKSLSSERENKQRGGLVRPLRKAIAASKAAFASTNSISNSDVAQGTDIAPVETDL